MPLKIAVKSWSASPQRVLELVSKMRTEIANDLVGILAGMDEDQAETVEHTKRAIHGRAIA